MRALWEGANLDLSTQLCVIFRCLAVFAPLRSSVCSRYVKRLFPTVIDGMASGANSMSFLILKLRNEALPVKMHLIQYSFPPSVRPLNLPSNSANVASGVKVGFQSFGL